MPGSRIYLTTTSLVELDGLVDSLGAYQNDATVTLESMVDAASGVAVVGLTVPLTMNYVAASNGKYQGQIPHTVTLTAERVYNATVLAISSGGARRQWVERVYCSAGEN